MGSLAVPLVLWGRNAPTHDITCILLTKDVKTLITASNDGQICVWDFDPPKLKMVPRVMLVGHSSRVTSLAQGSISSAPVQTLVSAAENGEFCLWDLRDGRCLEIVTSCYVHKKITAHQMLGSKELRLFCIGNYPEIHVYSPETLQILCSLGSKLNPDWVAAVHVLRPAKRNDEVVLGITQSGWVKVWTVSDKDVAGGDVIYEHESKKIRATYACCLVCCVYNQRTVLIVTPKDWQIYDAGDFSQLVWYGARQQRTSSENHPQPSHDASKNASQAPENFDEEYTYTGGGFLTNDTVVVYGESGRGYIYKLPNNCVVGSKEFHKKQIAGNDPILIGICKPPDEASLITPPSWQFQIIPVHTGAEKLLVRGDCEGGVLLWRIMDYQPQQLKALLSVKPVQPVLTKPTLATGLENAWASVSPPPIGLLDHIVAQSASVPGSSVDNSAGNVCATLFLGCNGRVACGRDDGTILLLPAIDVIMAHLLLIPHNPGVNQYMVLRGHSKKVTCLLYPYGEIASTSLPPQASSQASPRYLSNNLVSGGADFAIVVWDLTTGAQAARFVVQAGPILQLMVTPHNCSVRVQQCILSLAADHSVALISLKDRRVVLLAAHHPTPVVSVKWRPLHDFLVVATADGSVHVWQMDTGHLDRVITGVVAEEVLAACDELAASAGGLASGDGSQAGLANPAIHLLRGLRHRNLAAIRHAAQRGIQQVLGEQSNQQDIHDSSKLRCCPLMIQPLRTNLCDPQSHVLFIDIEALIVQLLSDEYATMSSKSLEDAELTRTSHYQRLGLLSHPASPEAAKKIAEFFGKVKDKAEEMEKKMKDKDKHDLIGRALERAAAAHSGVTSNSSASNINPHGSLLLSRVKESAGSVQSFIQSTVDEPRPETPQAVADEKAVEVPIQCLQIGQLIMSLLHSWGLDPSLDASCHNLLGLHTPKVPPAFGLIAKSGFMSLFMPTWHPVKDSGGPAKPPPPNLAAHLPPELLQLQHAAQVFSSRGHWEMSSAVTTQHLVALVALASALLHRNSSTLHIEKEIRRRLHMKGKTSSELESEIQNEETRIKQAWTSLTALHTVLLPDALKKAGSSAYQPPLLESLARRWQNKCQEVQDAAQALLKTELRRMGRDGRHKLIEEWAHHLPTLADPFPSTATNTGLHTSAPNMNQTVNQMNETNAATSVIVNGNHVTSPSGSNGYSNSAVDQQQQHHEVLISDDQFDDDNLEGVSCGGPDLPSAAGVYPSNQGGKLASGQQGVAIILLAVIGAEHGHDQNEGYGLGSTVAIRTSKALAHLLLSPSTPRLPLHTPLRRAAIDLIGRGFPVWEPYLDVAKVVLALLELCSDTHELAPSMKYGLPLVPEADSCRTASQSLINIASARPGVLITTLAREVARYNALQQNAQSLQMNLHLTTLHRAKTEILRLMEHLIQTHRSSVTKLMVEVMDIILHCVDTGHLRGGRSLNEVFPSLANFPQVSHCMSSKRIATGSSQGTIAIYDLRHSKCQVITAHTGSVTAVAFSPDGKHLTSYSMVENKLSFWQTSSGIFGLGSSQTKCTKSFTTVPVLDVVLMNPQRFPRLVWISNRTVVLMIADGTEHRFNA